MKWISPDSLTEACRHLAEPGARVVAGCTSVTPRTLSRDSDATLIDLSTVSALQRTTRDGGRIVIGAMVSIDMLTRDPHVGAGAKLLAGAAGAIGDAVLRRQATIGGNVMACAAWELPAALVALDATLQIATPRGQRQEPAEALCRPEFSLAPGEILAGIEIAAAADARWSYRRATTNSGAFICSVAAVRRGGAARLALAGGLDHPIRLERPDAVPPLRSDALATAGYRQRVAQILAHEAMEELSA